MTLKKKNKCGNFEIAFPINITGTFVFAGYAFLLELANPDNVLIKSRRRGAVFRVSVSNTRV